MADGGPHAPQLPSAHPPPVVPDVLPAPPEQHPAPPVQLVQDPVQPAQVQVQPGQPSLNWSYFKSEFSGKPEEDAKAHLLRTDDWMGLITSEMKQRYKDSVKLLQEKLDSGMNH